MSLRRSILGLSAFAAVSLSTLAAHAVPPPTMVGVWNGFVNQTNLRITITAQAAGAACRAVTGNAQTLPGLAAAGTVQGFYCPGTGRFSLLRKQTANNDTIQVLTGNVGDVGAVLRMSGTAAVHTGGGLPLGEYNFNFTRP